MHTQKNPQVIKISSKLLICPQKENIVDNLAGYIASCWDKTPSILVISGAIVLGARKLGIDYDELVRLKKTLPKNKKIEFLQDCSGIGQPILEKVYSDIFDKYQDKIKATAQILFEEDDFLEHQSALLNKRIHRYLGMDVVPKFNANNTLDFYEVTKDNDEPGAKIAIVSGAGRYIMLTEEDGLFADYKNKNSFLDEITTDNIEKCLKHCHDENCSNGGMESKLKAAKLAAENDIETIIASYKYPMSDIISGKQRSTIVRKV